MAYMAPECFNPDIGGMSAKADIFSLGIIMWWVLGSCRGFVVQVQDLGCANHCHTDPHQPTHPKYSLDYDASTRTPCSAATYQLASLTAVTCLNYGTSTRTPTAIINCCHFVCFLL